MNASAWISAMRLRTLPLAASCIITGSALAMWEGEFQASVFGLALLTTLLLQILSNLANDYGDGIKGTDNETRVGPARAIQSGSISIRAMKVGIVLVSIGALVSGLILLSTAFAGKLSTAFWLLFILGLVSIAAALKYTIGKTAYGYRGLGDIFVFIFFGWVGVIGTHFLHTGVLNWSLALPASSIGLFAVGVLNLNNMRDHVSDAQANKNTLVVMMGFNNAKRYHTALIAIGWFCMLAFAFVYFSDTWHYLFLLALPIFILNLKWVSNVKQPQQLDGELKKVALGTFLFSLLIAIGQWIA